MSAKKHPLPATRDDALDKGEVFYFTGVPCRRGHLSKRYTTSGTCLQCLNEKYEQKRRAFAIVKLRKLQRQAGIGEVVIPPEAQTGDVA